MIDIFSLSLGLAVVQPPDRFVGAYEGPSVVRHYPFKEVDSRCRAGYIALNLPGPDYKIAACGGEVSMHLDGGGVQSVCVMILPDLGDVSPETYANLVRHELAHCNGWPAH